MTVNKCKLALITILLSSLLSGCTPIESGRVIDKHYSPAYSTMFLQTVGDITVPIITEYTESYKVKIEGSDRTAWQEVPKEYYENVEIGDRYDR